MKKYNTTLWITLIFISVKYLPSADSLQCFECENCAIIGEDARDYITECSTVLESLSTELPDSTTTRNESAISSESIQSSTPSSTSITNSTNASSSVISSTSTLTSPSTIVNNTETTQKLGSTEIPTTQSSSSSSSSVGSTSTTETSDLFNWNSRQADEVCYVLKFKYEGQEITKRGCGLRGQNKDQTCQLLSKGEQNSECDVCVGNLCNGGSRLRTGVIGIVLIILFVLKTCVQ